MSFRQACMTPPASNYLWPCRWKKSLSVHRKGNWSPTFALASGHSDIQTEFHKVSRSENDSLTVFVPAAVDTRAVLAGETRRKTENTTFGAKVGRPSLDINWLGLRGIFPPIVWAAARSEEHRTRAYAPHQDGYPRWFQRGTSDKSTVSMITMQKRFAWFVFLAALAPAADLSSSRPLRQPHISARQIASIYGGDVWTATRSGTEPRPYVPPVGGQVQFMEVLRPPRPAYPEKAAQAGSQGQVVFFVRGKADGSSEILSVLASPDAELEASARQAAGQMRFDPMKVNGKAVDWDFEFTVDFRLSK